jgi:ABC-type nitrate/sulfonate/bicarbonate transport system permease component
MNNTNENLWLKLEPWLPGLIVLVGLIVWELLSRAGLISLLFFPPPSVILRALFEMITSGKITIHLTTTLARIGLGFLIGGVFGLILGLGMGWSPRLQKIADPIIAAVHPIPKIAIFPLIMIIFGIGEISKIVAIAVASFFPMLINSMAGVRQIHPIYFEVTQNYGASRWNTFKRVVLPGSLPMILTATRLSLNMALVITIAVELISANEGLGVMIWYAWQILRIEDLYASLIVISILGISLNQLLQWLSKRVVPWHIQPSDKKYL